MNTETQTFKPDDETTHSMGDENEEPWADIQDVTAIGHDDPNRGYYTEYEPIDPPTPWQN